MAWFSHPGFFLTTLKIIGPQYFRFPFSLVTCYCSHFQACVGLVSMHMGKSLGEVWLKRFPVKPS